MFSVWEIIQNVFSEFAATMAYIPIIAVFEIVYQWKDTSFEVKFNRLMSSLSFLYHIILGVMLGVIIKRIFFI